MGPEKKIKIQCDNCPGMFCGVCHYRRPPREIIERHERELSRRIAIAYKRGVLPHTLVASADNGLDDENFVNKRPEIRPDGTVDPQAVFFQPSDSTEDRIHQQNQTHTQSWTCQCPCKCGAVVNSAPRKFIPSKTRKTEPADWWWCMDCKISKRCHDLKPSAKQLREQKLSEQCSKMVEYFDKHDMCATP